jgi:hypothetical protein
MLQTERTCCVVQASHMASDSNDPPIVVFLTQKSPDERAQVVVEFVDIYLTLHD